MYDGVTQDFYHEEIIGQIFRKLSLELKIVMEALDRVNREKDEAYANKTMKSEKTTRSQRVRTNSTLELLTIRM